MKVTLTDAPAVVTYCVPGLLTVIVVPLVTDVDDDDDEPTRMVTGWLKPEAVPPVLRLLTTKKSPVATMGSVTVPTPLVRATTT